MVQILIFEPLSGEGNDFFGIFVELYGVRKEVYDKRVIVSGDEMRRLAAMYCSNDDSIVADHKR